VLKGSASGLEEFPFLDLLSKLRGGPNRSQLSLRLEFKSLGFDCECTGTTWQKLALQALSELAYFRDAFVID